MQYSVIILAAGSGKRTGLNYNKMFFKIDDQMVIEKTLIPFIEDPDCQQIILVVNEKEVMDFKQLKTVLDHPQIELVIGGKERQNSVYNGLQQVTNDFVMIHDGARCFIDKTLIERLKSELKGEQAGLLMVDSVDTSKIVKNGYVEKTLIRNEVKLAQTPQCFKTSLIKQVHEKASRQPFNFSDDASMVEQLSDVKVKVVPGEYYNKKITTKEDVKNLYK